MYYEEDEEQLDAAEMLLLLRKDPDLGMDIVYDTATEVLQTFDDSDVSIPDLDASGRNLYVLCTVIKYMYEQYVLSTKTTKMDITPESNLH